MSINLELPTCPVYARAAESRLIDAAETVQLLHKAAEDFGREFVSTHARYVTVRGAFWEGEQARFHISCIVGHVLHQVGIPLWALADAPLPGNFRSGYHPLSVRFTAEAERMLIQAMGRNDNGWEWGLIADQAEKGWKAGLYVLAA